MISRRAKAPKQDPVRERKSRTGFFVANIRQSASARFGIALRRRRVEVGLTQEQIASRSGMSRSYISEVECGKENISLERAERLALAVDSTLLQLLK